MNKIKEQLIFKMLGQLSDENTTVDVDNAYSVVKEISVSFSLFCAKNYSSDYFSYDKQLWFDRKTGRDLTTEKLFKIWENENQSNSKERG